MRFLIIVVVTIVVALFLGSACALPWRMNLSATTRPGLPPTAVAPSQIPALRAAPPVIAVALAPWPLHGSPPFTANFFADVGGYAGPTSTCQAARWEFGDGTSEAQPCQSGVSLSRFQISHVYREAGTYHARLVLIFANGEEAHSTTQTIIVAVPQPVSQGLEIWRGGIWMASIIAAVGGGLWLRRRSRCLKIGGYAVIILGLITFVPPFSYLPDPLGLYWAAAGSYAYDPRLPFVNRFVVAGDPEAQLRPFLDGLIGQTGLDPLDPAQPLARYEFVRVWLPCPYPGVVFVTTQLTYQDGTQRSYDIPLYQATDFLGWYRSGWRYDGLGRLRTEHRELAGTPFSNAALPLRLSTPQRLNLHQEARQFDAASPANWGPSGSDWQHLIWSPRGDAFLAARSPTADRRDLWQIDLTGGPPRLVAENVLDYDWSPDGEYIIFTRHVQQLDAAPVLVFTADRTGHDSRELAQLTQPIFPGLTNEGVWYTTHTDLWLAPYDGQPPRRIATLTGLASSPFWHAGPLVRPAPDGERIAYTCGDGNALCLYDRVNAQVLTSDLPASDLVWVPGGSQLAVITAGTYGNAIEGDQSVRLAIVEKDGRIKQSVSIAPNGWADAPHWTPDARRVLIQTYPDGGRRILVCEVATGEMVDLSQPRWDAWFALSPDGRRLLLNNGRGDFWIARLEAFAP